VLTGAGNIARCATRAGEATAQLLDRIPGTVATLGDNAMPYGRSMDYQNCYAPTWGRHLSRTWGVLGNHEYDSSATADGAFDYFVDRAGPRGLGYYSFDIGAWHVIVLNDNGAAVPFAAGSAQEQWLRADLAANARPCTMALWHVPLFLSSNTAGYMVNPSRKILWDDLAAAGVDVVLNGHQHHYERMAPMNPDGTRNDATGIRQFNVGTGGDGVIMPTVTIHPNSEVRATDYGVLRLTLRPTRYDWEFVPVAGQSFVDPGSGTCH
jgi:calcineurin-like phosphoesterase family protein